MRKETKQAAIRKAISVISEATGTRYRESDVSVNADGDDIQIGFPVDGVEMMIYMNMGEDSGIEGMGYELIMKNSSGSSLEIIVTTENDPMFFDETSESDIVIATLDMITEIKSSIALLEKGIRKSALDTIVKAFNESDQDSPVYFRLDIEESASQFHLECDGNEIHLDFNKKTIDWIYPSKKQTSITASSLNKVSKFIESI